MKHKYFAHTWRGILKHEIEKETADYVWITGRKWKKLTQNEGYFDDFESAKAFLVEIARKDLARAKREVDYYRSKLEEAERLKEGGNNHD